LKPTIAVAELAKRELEGDEPTRRQYLAGWSWSRPGLDRSLQSAAPSAQSSRPSQPFS